MAGAVSMTIACKCVISGGRNINWYRAIKGAFAPGICGAFGMVETDAIFGEFSGICG
jgi:hypothetical protein